MSEETWDIELGERSFKVGRLPFKISRVVYPICQKLTNDGFAERIYGKFEGGAFTPPPPLQVTDEEMDQLAKVALLTCQTADPNLTEEAFNDMPIAPFQLYDAFFTVRKACGGWRSNVEGKKESGEATEMEEPPT